MMQVDCSLVLPELPKQLAVCFRWFPKAKLNQPQIYVYDQLEIVSAVKNPPCILNNVTGIWLTFNINAKKVPGSKKSKMFSPGFPPKSQAELLTCWFFRTVKIILLMEETRKRRDLIETVFREFLDVELILVAMI